MCSSCCALVERDRVCKVVCSGRVQIGILPRFVWCSRKYGSRRGTSLLMRRMVTCMQVKPDVASAAPVVVGCLFCHVCRARMCVG